MSQETVSDEQLQAARRLCATACEVRQRVWEPRRFEQLASLWSHETASVRATYNPPFARLVHEQASIIQPDAVIAFEMAVAPYVAQVGTAVRVLEELEITNILDQYRNAPPRQRLRAWLTWSKHRAYVQRLLRSFDACTVVSERERSFVQQIAPAAMPIAVIPNGASTTPLANPPMPRSDSLIYPGALSYSANLDAMRYFTGDILPRIRAQRPDVQLRITGKTTPEQRAALPSLDGVELTGYIADIRTAVAEATCEVVPLREGGGTRLKILEALALGTPVIATRKGAEGLDLVDGRDLLIADAPEAFANLTLQVLSNPDLRQSLAEHGRRSVQERYDWQAIGGQLSRFVEQVAHSQERHYAPHTV
jgi:glycosyltransferase involved in cell wall biosynthesis